MTPDVRRSSEREGVAGRLNIRLRILGFLPLIFWLAHAHHYLQYGGLPHLLWMCNLASILLAMGLFLSWPFLIRLAVIWFIPGLPIWVWFVVMQSGGTLTSFFAHVGGLLVGLFALFKVRADHATWLYALVWYLAVQQVCRMFTPPELNVNLAHEIWSGWERDFAAYWQFWLLTTLLTGIGLRLLGLILLKLFPPLSAGDLGSTIQGDAGA